MTDLKIYAYQRNAVVVSCKSSDAFVVIPSEYRGKPVTAISERAFYKQKSICQVQIPPTLQIIGDEAFAECSSLARVDYAPEELAAEGKKSRRASRFPQSLTSIGMRAFAGTALRSVDMETEWAVSIGELAFEGTSELESFCVMNCKDKLLLGKGTFRHSGICYFVAPKAKFDTIPEECFYECLRLISVMGTYSSIGPKSFMNCLRLSTLETTKEVKMIGDHALDGCNALKKPCRPTESNESSAKSTSCMEELFEDYEIADFPKERKPIFTMEAKIEPSPRRKQWKFKGVWFRQDNRYQFIVNSPASMTAAELYVAVDMKWRPLVTHLASNQANVTLLAEYRDSDTCLVYDMELCSAIGKLTPTLFREVMNRLRKPVFKQSDTEKKHKYFSAQTTEEHALMQTLASATFPGWVLSAYKANKEKAMNPATDESSRKHARTAMNVLMEIDWSPCEFHLPPATEVKRILDQSFWGLEEVKTRIMEVVAQIRRTGKFPKYGLLLSGPPGVGKTAIAGAIAQIFDAGLIQLDINSIGRDPENLTGSSRTYSNSSMGFLLERMHQNRSSTAVLLASELDKGLSDQNHAVVDVLLPVLDKTGYLDSCLEEIIPTDNIFCIATANDLSKLSGPIKDRFTVIGIPPYTEGEKKTIFTDFVLPNMQREKCVSPEKMRISANAAALMIREYAVEPGVRDLERFSEIMIGDYCLLQDESDRKNELVKEYTEADIRRLFGRGNTLRRVFSSVPGEINAACYFDGIVKIFPVQASVEPGDGSFQVLGPMSKLQNQYCQTAYCCVRNTVDSKLFDFSKLNVTVFVPEDIPSGTGNHLGLAVYAAICSRLFNRNLATQSICFIGGVDLFGSTYGSENDLTPLLKAMKSHGVTTLFAPMGTSAMLPEQSGDDGLRLQILEAPSVKALFSLTSLAG